ncbi:penicillin-binding protein 2 [Desulfosarcina ovata]|uniref:Penicillin-binding protein 2 n=1 Tax=Desulfosarcina ovata subsp. ovata TaxID=2752305 RepID=A0A5K8AJJ5_9BACT|nr:penicillin-binding protein 2 [Desulfosarcina ovata]BBO92686.1 penicillin-binding protein 2 [Desulfosarcina ovata subsp. ovata]
MTNYLDNVDSEWFSQRLSVALTIVVAAFVILIARLFYLQVINGAELRRQSEINSIRLKNVDATRGLIYDCQGRLLADNRPAYDLNIIVKDAGPLEPTIAKLSDYSGIPEAQLWAQLEKAKGSRAYKPVLLKPDISRDELAAIEVNRWDLPGIMVNISPRRDYVFSPSAAHILGYMGEINVDELKQKRHQGCKTGDYIGKYGIERAREPWLRGKRGGQQVEVNATGQVVRVLSTVDAVPGNNVVLSIDHALQVVAEELLVDQAGAAVAVEPDTGQVLAMVSSPSFDQNAFISGMSHDAWNVLISDPQHPLENKAIQAEYPPASTYKIIAAAAGLEEGLIDESSSVFCPGFLKFGNRTYRCWKRWGHGEVDIYKALSESCDVYFYKLGQELGVDRLAWYARAFGLGEPTGIDLNHEGSGLVPTAAWKKRRTGISWQKGETLSVVIGQGFNLTTPLQMAMVAATVGNGGTRYRPKIVKTIRTADGKTLYDSTPEVVGRLPVSEKNLNIVREGLFKAVNSRHGTAWRSRLDGMAMSGKTGTAQVVGRREEDTDGDGQGEPIKDHAWFVAYAPREHPKIAVSVIVEHGEHGSSAAAPVAAEMIRFYLSGGSQAADTTAPEGSVAPGQGD